MIFTLTEKELVKVKKWKKKMDKKRGSDYYGAIGGELTYSFTPTGIGCITKVIHSNGEELDLTDWDSW